MFRFTLPNQDTDCVLFTIKSYVNISEDLSEIVEHRQISSPTVAGKVAVIPLNLENFFLRKDKPNRHIFLSSGLIEEKFAFGTEVTPKRNTNASGYFKPFDSSIWILLTTSILLLSILSEQIKTVDFMRTRFTSSDILFTLFSQCNIQLFSRHLTFKILCILPIWYYASMLLSELYKGELLSMMTVFTIPNAPKSLEDILKYENFYLATTKHMSIFQPDKTVEIRSVIKNTMRDILEHDLSVSRKELFMKISNRLQFLGNGSTLAIINDFWKARIGKNDVSTNLIYLDGEKDVNVLKLIVGFFTEKQIIKGESIDEFTTTNAMIFQRNFLYKLINPYITMLDASGIPQHWMKFWDMKAEVFILKIISDMLNSSDLRKESIFSFVISNHRGYNKKPEPISMMDIEIFGYTYLLLVVVCDIAFTFEIVRSRWFKNNLKNQILRLFKIEKTINTKKSCKNYCAEIAAILKNIKVNVQVMAYSSWAKLGKRSKSWFLLGKIPCCPGVKWAKPSKTMKVDFYEPN